MDPHLRRLLSPGPAEIIRAAKKDSDFITKLSQDVLDVSHGLFGLYYKLFHLIELNTQWISPTQ